MKSFPLILFTLAVGFLLAITLSQVLAAFSEPSSAPPEGNVPEPINVSDATQYKTGAFGVGGVFQADNLAVFNGSVGIGTPIPTQKLDIAGEVHATGDVCSDVNGGVCLSSSASSQGFGVRVYNSVSISSEGRPITLTFDSERYDDGDLHSTTDNISRLTAPQTGKYIIWGNAIMPGYAYSQLSIRLNNSINIAKQRELSGQISKSYVNVSTVYHLNAGDYVELVSYHWQSECASCPYNVSAEPNVSPEFGMEFIR